MPGPFDAASKALIDPDPLAWLRFIGLPGEAAKILDSDLTTALTCDRLLLVSRRGGRSDYLAHTELQASRDANLPHRMMAYNAAAGYNYGLEVVTIVVLLRESADSPELIGRFQFGSLTFDYQVLRLWNYSPDDLLAGSPALLPLLPLTSVAYNDLPGYIRQARVIADRLPEDQREETWTRMRLLLGMKYDAEQSYHLLRGVYQMLDLRESSTYREILAEGEAKGKAEGKAEGKVEGKTDGERRLILLQATKRFGEPNETAMETLANIDSPEALEQIALKIFEVESWEELLA